MMNLNYQADSQQGQHTEDHATEYSYDNTGWPRDFDIRIEVAEQQEVLREHQSFMHCS